jgi:hypothetical protein
MPDGTTLKGAQGSFPIDRSVAYGYRTSVATAKDPAQALNDVRANERSLYAMPWLKPDPLADLDRMSVNDIAAPRDVIPPGVVARHRSSPLFPVQVPDLIGVKDRHYLDRTGLQQQRSIDDMMRYAALNQGGDDFGNYDGFIPADFPNSRSCLTPPTPITSEGVIAMNNSMPWRCGSIRFSRRPTLTSSMLLLSADRRFSSGRAASRATPHRCTPTTN